MGELGLGLAVNRNAIATQPINASQHLAEALSDIGIRYAQDLKAFASKLRLSDAVRLDLEVVHGPIDLDHQLRGVAIEVDDESDEDMLTSELKPAQSMASKIPPQDHLGRCLASAQLFRKCQLAFTAVWAFVTPWCRQRVPLRMPT